MSFPTQSVLINGTTQYMSRAKTGSSNLYTVSDFTWEGLVKLTALPGVGTVANLYTQSWANGANLSFALQLDNTGGTYSLRIRGGSTGNQDFNVTLGSLGAITTAVWYHLAIVYTASTHTAEGFKNGVSTGTSTSPTSSIFNGTDPVVIGAEGDFSNKLSGRFGMMRFWKTTRTSGQLSANQCNLLGSTANLGGEWTFDNTYNDNSGNSNTLTATGTPTFAADVSSVCIATATANPAFLLNMV